MRGLGSAHWQELEREAIGANADIETSPAVVGGIGVGAAGCVADALDNDDLDALSTGLQIAGGAMAAYGFFDTMRLMSNAAAVARAHGMALPGLGRTRLLVLGMPLLLLTLAFAEETFACFYEAISSVDVETEGSELLDAGLVNAPALPEEFRRAFLAGDYYTTIDVDLDDIGTLRAWALFDTEPKEEFDEYSSPRISIYLTASRI